MAAFTFVLTVGITFAAVDWWPGASRGLDAFTNLLIMVGLGGLLLIAGLVWAVKTLYLVGRDRRWSWWIVPAPAIVVAALLVILLVPAPFHSARGDFEAAAQRFSTSPESQAFDVNVGPFTISSITREADGTIYFHDSDQAFFHAIGGWVYSPAEAPTGDGMYEKFESRHIDGPWYEFNARHPNW